MERALKKTFTILAIFILLCGITLNIGQISALAADEDIPKEGVTYTLTYPDGAVVTEKDGKPLSFDDVTESLKGENWRLLGSGYTSDKDGKAVLPSSWTEGTIKIIETKVPTGYTQGTDSTQIVDIKDGTVEFVNPKIKEEETTYSITYKLNGGEFNGSTEDIVEKYPEGTVIDIHEAPTREGYEFDYWEGSKYYPGDKYTVVEDHTLVAQWKENSDDNDIIDDEDNNNNDNDSDDTQKTDTTSDKSKKTVIKETKSVAATGDTADLSLYFGFFISSLLVIAFSLSYRFVFAAGSNASINSRKAKSLIIAVIISMAAGIAMASIAYSAGGFTINKVDDNGDPVEGAVFDVYGKPAVSFEEKEQEKVNISGTKTWEDAYDQDGKRPDSITVRLHADGKEVDSKVVTAEGDWKYFFTDKPKYEGNKEIAYSITEDAVADYKTELSGFDITNSYTPGKTSLTVTKVWEDADDQDGIRPDSVKVNLLADGEKTKEATLSADSRWTYTFKELDEKKDGETINYTVEEADEPEGYTAKVTGSAKEGFTITNSHSPETVNIKVEKNWDDQDMFEDEGKPLGSYKRPDSVTITLWDEDKKEVVRAKVSEDTNWIHTWTLPKYKAGAEIDYQEYMVGEAEANVPVGFAQEIGHPSSEGEGLYTAAVLNVPKVREEYTPVEVKLVKYSEAKTIPATDGEEPRDVPSPGVEFAVTEEGAESEASQTITTDAEGKATFEAAEPGKKLVIKETKTREGYYNNGATFTLGVEKGKLESLVFDADKREWVKTYGLYTEALSKGKSPEDLTIETPPLEDVNGNYLEENENSYILRNKPLATLVVEKYFIGAGMITYEDAPEDFAITLSYTDAAGNAQEKELTVNGEYWQSGGDPSLCRWLVPGIPYNAKVKLKESGLGKQGYALTNTEAFVWRMDPNGPRYESDMADEAEISADKRTVTFNMPAHFDSDPAWKYSEEYGGGSLGLLGARVRFQNHYSTTIDITGTKIWRDGGKTHDNAKEVTLTLYRRASSNVADEEKVEGATPTWDGNKYTFANQPKYDSQRYEFIYEVREETVPDGYKVSYADASGTALDNSATGVPNGGTITNTHTPTTVTVSGKKTWTSSTGNNDDLDTSKIPEKYTVRLEKSTDGTNWTTVTTQEVASYMAPPPMSPTDPILPTDEWKFSNLPAKDGGVDIQYRVVEVEVPEGFTMSGGTKDANGKYNLTNTYTPTTSSVNINVGLNYRVYSGGTWAGVVKTSPQVVTVSGGSMTESKTLSFTPGSDAQEVELPGAGTYTIAMTGISKDDLQPESALSLLKDDYMPIIVDTVSAKVTVDENGNCTVDNANTTCTSFALGYNSNSEEFIYNDIDALKEAYLNTGADDKLNTLNPHSNDAGASASGSTVTLTTVVSQGWDNSTEPAVQ